MIKNTNFNESLILFLSLTSSLATAEKTLFLLNSGERGRKCLLRPSVSLRRLPAYWHPSNTYYFPQDLCLVIARHKKFKMMDLVVYYLCCTCQMWSRRPMFVDERPTLAEGSKSNSCSNWGDCQSKAELTHSHRKKPIRSTSRQRGRRMCLSI